MAFRSSFLFFAALSVSTFACAVDADDESGDLADESTSDLSASRIGQLGVIDSGSTKTAHYTKSPLYRAYSFVAAAGDTVDISVASANGDAVAYLLRASFSTLARNDDANATTNDAHLTAKIATAGTYFIAFKEAKGRDADFSVTFKRTPHASVDAGPGPGPGPSSSDPFDPASCSGAPLDFASKFSPGAAEAVLGEYQIVLRKRQCTSVTGCSAWQATTEHSGPSGHGKATLAVNPQRLVLVGDEASSAYGTPHIDLGTGCTLNGLEAKCSDYYVTEIMHGAWPFLVGPRERHYRIGTSGVGSYHIDGDKVALAGTITNHCLRLVAHPTKPDEIYPNAPYADFEAAILLRY